MKMLKVLVGVLVCSCLNTLPASAKTFASCADATVDASPSFSTCMVAELSAAAGADSSPPPSSMDAIVNAAAATYLNNPGTAALSISISYQGRDRTYHFGRISKARPDAPTDDTVFPIASITKTFTGALLATAELDGRLDTNDPVTKYLDGRYANLQFGQQPVRLFHLLNHRSGLPFILPNPPEADPDFDSPIPYPVRLNTIVAHTSRGMFYDALAQVKLKSAPGANFAYSNAGAQLAGYVVERVYGRDYETLLRRYITAPLRMRNTAIELNPAQTARLAPGHEQDGTIQPQESTNSQGAGAIKSTIRDMLVYARWQLDESNPVVALSHKPTYSNEDFAIGLNWQMLRDGQRRVIWQDGAIPGYASFCILQPESKLALVILSNELDSQTLGRLSMMANRIMRELEPLSVTKP